MSGDLPGHRARELDWTQGAREVMTITHELATRAGAEDIMFGWEVLDRVCLARETRPRPSDRFMWWFAATRTIPVDPRRPLKITVRGEQVVEPGGDYTRGCALAAIEFLEKLGVHVTGATRRALDGG